ncbi:MAG: biopolymer transporter ExbD [Flavobacteriales bacterium]|jgi:biopolymer transport protein ExbD|nr:biopolymer transporter ExbD [Flavobacteriales bacterium]|tara:strand:- start:928 stop:1398 length:471 start_codon:yes stop_codon:yes gene_type:complete
MSKFKKNTNKKLAPISTASLPDIVFMLLFFFMVTTVMRETEMLVENILPQATEVKKLERKSLVSYIYIGAPKGKNRKGKYGTEAKLQLNDSYAKVADIQSFVIAERETRAEEEVPLLTTSIKADVNVKMGIVSDIKQELRKAQAYKINYSTRKDEK